MNENDKLLHAERMLRTAQEALRNARRAAVNCSLVDAGATLIAYLDKADTELRLAGYALEARISEVTGVA